MRYLIKKKNKTGIILKSLLSVSVTLAVSVLVLSFHGDVIVKSAYSLMVPGTDTVYNSSDAVDDNFESEFLNFLSYEKKENTKQTAQTNSEAIAVNLSAISGKYKNYDGTSVINNTDYSVNDLLYAEYDKPEIDKNKPAVLIYHTHTSEEYFGGGTVVDVGNEMVKEFENSGYKTIHITDNFDKEQFSGAYSRSIKAVEKALSENPDIKLVFDVHRDAITAANGDTYRPVTKINGDTSAQVMFVCGTDEKGLSHPNWRENFKFALDVSRNASKKYGALSRPVNLRGDRFNTHTRKHSFLIEVGSSANTLDEAKIAAKYTVRAIIDTIN